MSVIERLSGRKSLTQDTLFFLLAACAVIAGIFFRFWDLGGAPLAVDEYFLGMATLNTAEHGLPLFDCGGYYKRGLLLQYLAVPLLSLGASLEFAVRFWPAAASVFSILAVWRISDAVGGRGVALVAVILTSLSLWEIEFGRFGRMYAPFQAAFLWYTYFQIQHLVKGKQSATWWYLGISAVAVLIYEGAALLLLTNFLPLVWRGKRWTYSHLAASLALLVATVVYFKKILTRFPDSKTAELASSAINANPGSQKPETYAKLAALPDLPENLLLLAIAAGCVLAIGLWKLYRRVEINHPSAIYWIGTCLCFCAGFIAFGVALILAGLLLRIPYPLKNMALNVRSIALGFTIFSMAWLGVLFISHLSGGAGVESSVKSALAYAFNFPDVYFKVVAPWLHAIPATTVILLLFGMIATVLCRQQESRQNTEIVDYLMGLSILLVLLVSLLPQPYESTRYTYFLYPILIILSSVGILLTAKLAAGLTEKLPPSIPAVALMAPLFLFAEDFRAGHLFQINQTEIRFRTDYSATLAAHYYLRWDFRGVADFVNARANPEDTILAFDQPFPYYLGRTSGIFVREETSNHELVAACNAAKDLWSNAPLLDQAGEVHDMIDNSRGRVWLLMRSDKYFFRDPLELIIPKRYGLSPEYISLDGNLAVFMIPGNS